MAKKIHCRLITKVLVYKDRGDDDYVAHSLEFDLIGYGDSPNKALHDLENAIDAQLGFAIQKEDMGLVFHKAPKELFERWEKALQGKIQDLAKDDVAMDYKYEAEYLEYSAKELQEIASKAHENKFKRSETMCNCA